MKNRLLYLTIGLLIGIIVMQWSCSSDETSNSIAGPNFKNGSENSILYNVVKRDEFSGPSSVQHYVMMNNGDTYANYGSAAFDHGSAVFIGNIFDFDAAPNTTQPPAPLVAYQLIPWDAGPSYPDGAVHYVVLANGDAYSNGERGEFSEDAMFMGNVFTGSTNGNIQ